MWCKRVLTYKTNLRFRQSLQTFIEVVSNNYPRISCKIGFTIKEKAFLLDYFRKRVKQENEDWYFVPPYTEEFQARCLNLMVLVINKFINVLKL
jgi:hypothetical protein